MNPSDEKCCPWNEQRTALANLRSDDDRATACSDHDREVPTRTIDARTAPAFAAEGAEAPKGGSDRHNERQQVSGATRHRPTAAEGGRWAGNRSRSGGRP